MALRRKQSGPEPRRRRMATNTVADATPTRNVYSNSSRREERPEPRRRLNAPIKSSKNPLIGIFAKGGSGLLVLSLLVLGVYLMTLSTEPVVRPLSDTDGLFIRSGDVYASAAEETLSSSLWNRSKLTVDPQSVESAMEKEFPELASVNVVVPFFGNRPVIYLEPAKPALILTALNGNYVLDETGKVLMNQANVPAGFKMPNLPVVADQSNLKAELNESAITEDDVQFIKAIVGQLNAKGVKYEGLTLPAGASELDVKIAGKPYYVKFNMQDRKHAREQAGTFFATEQELTRKKITPSQYIDVRVEGRAYYR